MLYHLNTLNSNHRTFHKLGSILQQNKIRSYILNSMQHCNHVATASMTKQTNIKSNSIQTGALF